MSGRPIKRTLRPYLAMIRPSAATTFDIAATRSLRPHEIRFRGRSLDPDRRYRSDPRRIRSRLNGPTGWVATYKNRKQYNAASSPPFKIGQNPRGACERK